MGPGRAGGGAVAQGATLLPTLADIRTLLMVGEDIKWRKQAQLKLEGGGENFYTKQKSFEFVFAKEWGGVLSFFFLTMRFRTSVNKQTANSCIFTKALRILERDEIFRVRQLVHLRGRRTL